MARSPPFDYMRDVWLPVLARLGGEASVELAAWGWYQVGKGEVRARIRGLGAHRAMLKPLELEERGPLLRIFGRAVAANLPALIPQRMADRCPIPARWWASICASNPCACVPLAPALASFSLQSMTI